MTFWDFYAPFYDIAEKRNKKAYSAMLETVKNIIPKDAEVMEIAAGTGSITLTIAEKAKSVVCSDISEKMLAKARKKISKHNIANVSFENSNIFEIIKNDSSFDAVIASQVMHLINDPEKAAFELQRVSKNLVIMPIALTKNLRGFSKLMIKIYMLLGFRPKREFTLNEYKAFINEIGFKNCEFIFIEGSIPMTVAVWRKNKAK